MVYGHTVILPLFAFLEREIALFEWLRDCLAERHGYMYAAARPSCYMVGCFSQSLWEQLVNWLTNKAAVF